MGEISTTMEREYVHFFLFASYLLASALLLIKILGTQEERDKREFGATWSGGLVDDRDEGKSWFHWRSSVVHMERRMYILFFRTSFTLLINNFMVLTRMIDAVCCHSYCIWLSGLDAFVPLCKSRLAGEVLQGNQRQIEWKSPHDGTPLLLLFSSFFFFFIFSFCYICSSFLYFLVLNVNGNFRMIKLSCHTWTPS